MINDQEYVTVGPLRHDESTHLTQITMFADKDEGDYFAVLVDGGAADSTTYMKGYLHGYKITSRKFFYDARKRAHVSVGEVYIKLLYGLNTTSYATCIFIHCYQTPTMYVTVLSPGRFVICHGSKYEHRRYMPTTGQGEDI
jgi:hypothetical protein